jgi:phage-related protein
VEAFAGNAYRAVYTVKFENVVYVLDAFQKKAKQGAEYEQTFRHPGQRQHLC